MSFYIGAATGFPTSTSQIGASRRQGTPTGSSAVRTTSSRSCSAHASTCCSTTSATLSCGAALATSARALTESAAARVARMLQWDHSPRTAETQLEFNLAAAERQRRRAWLAAADPLNDPMDLALLDPANCQMHEDAGATRDLAGLSQLPSSMKVFWRKMRPMRAALPPSHFWPTVETLAGGWATSYRLHVQPGRRSCIFGCSPG